MRERKAFDFETLTCAECGSVEAYVQKFVELCPYAPALVATDRQKACRFIKGLPTYM